MDILLQVGIDISSLKSARTQIASEIQSWKFPKVEKAPIINEEQIKSATKAVKDLSNEIPRVIDSWKPAAQEENVELLGRQAEQSDKLTKATEYNRLQNEALGPSIATVRAELNTYLRAQASDVPLTTQEIARKKELITTYDKMQKATKGLLHGLDIGRVVAWAVAWTTIYSTFRLVTNAITQSIKSWIDFDTAIARVSTAIRQAGLEHKAVMSALTFTAIEYSRRTSVAATDVAKTMYHLASAGLDAKETMQGFEHVLSLTVGTFGNVDQIARLVASSYILFGDSIEHATTVSEKFQYISDVLAEVYTVHQVELSEIANAFSYVGGASTLLNIKFEALVGTIGFLNDGMLRGSKAGTALMESFVSLGDKTDRLREDFGVVWDISKPIDFVEIMQQLKNSIGDTAKSTLVFSQLMSIFGTRGSRAIVQILARWSDWQEAIRILPKDIEGASKKMQDIVESAVGGSLAKIKNQFQAIVTTLLNTLEPQILGLLGNISKKFESGELIDFAEKWGTILITIFTTIYGLIHDIALQLAIMMRYITPAGYSYEFRKYLQTLEDMPSGIELSSIALKNFKDIINATKRATEDLNEAQKKSDTFGFTIAKGLSPEKQITILEKIYSVIEDRMIEIINLRGMENDEVQEYLEKLTKIKDQITVIENTEKSYAKEVQKANLELSRQYEIDFLNARGVSEVIIKQKEFTNLLKTQIEYLKNTHPELNAAELEIDVMTKSIEELSEKYRGIFEPETLKKFKEQFQEITLVFEKEIGDLANDFQSATTTYVKSLLTGTADIKDFMSSIVDAYQTAFSEQIGKMIADTGIFGDMANAFLSPMQQMHKNIYDAMVEGSIVAAQNLKAGVSGADIPGTVDTTKQSVFGSAISAVGTFLGISKVSKERSDATTKKQTDAAEKTAESTSKLSQAITAGKQIAGVGMGLYSGYQGVMAASKQGGVQGALGGAMSGAMAGSMFGPIGTAVGAIAGGLFGAFGGKKNKIPDQIKESTIEIKSAISISNKELQLISRNTEAMRKGFEGFVFQRSAYFSERMGVEERWNLDSITGYNK